MPRSPSIPRALDEPSAQGKCPNSIDAIFENVVASAWMLPDATQRIRTHRPLRAVAGYDGQDIAIHNVRALLVSRVTRGFIVAEHLECRPQANELGEGVAAGASIPRTVARGLAPHLAHGLLAGRISASRSCSWPDGADAERTNPAVATGSIPLAAPSYCSEAAADRRYC
jgi:hypothetical protein